MCISCFQRRLSVKPLIRRLGEALAVGEQAFKRHGARDGSVVEEEVDAAARGKIAHVRASGVNLAAFDILEAGGGNAALGLGLRRREDGELDAVGGEDFEGLDVDGGFSQPHAFGIAIEAELEVANSPYHLSLLVAAIGQRHDHVVVDLRDGGTVSGKRSAGFRGRLREWLDRYRQHGRPSRTEGWGRR